MPSILVGLFMANDSDVCLYADADCQCCKADLDPYMLNVCNETGDYKLDTERSIIDLREPLCLGALLPEVLTSSTCQCLIPAQETDDQLT